MPRIAPTNWKVQMEVFQLYGCRYKRKKGSHHILTHPNAKRAVVIPEYKEIVERGKGKPVGREPRPNS